MHQHFINNTEKDICLGWPEEIVFGNCTKMEISRKNHTENLNNEYYFILHLPCIIYCLICHQLHVCIISTSWGQTTKEHNTFQSNPTPWYEFDVKNCEHTDYQEHCVDCKIWINKLHFLEDTHTHFSMTNIS